MLNILIVDDSKAIHAYMNDCFSETEHVLFHVFDGQEAIDRITNKELPSIDLMLLDWEMPNMSGLECFEALTSSGVKMPTIMVTTKNRIEDIKKMLGAGVNDYIMKPFTGEIILEKIASVLDQEVA